jgi:Na+/proline symporter
VPACTALGGVLTVSLTDRLQACITLPALLLVPAVVAWQTGGLG